MERQDMYVPPPKTINANANANSATSTRDSQLESLTKERRGTSRDERIKSEQEDGININISTTGTSHLLPPSCSHVYVCNVSGTSAW